MKFCRLSTGVWWVLPCTRASISFFVPFPFLPYWSFLSQFKGSPIICKINKNFPKVSEVWISVIKSLPWSHIWGFLKSSSLVRPCCFTEEKTFTRHLDDVDSARFPSTITQQLRCSRSAPSAKRSQWVKGKLCWKQNCRDTSESQGHWKHRRSFTSVWGPSLHGVLGI